jgi:carbon storage regulator
MLVLKRRKDQIICIGDHIRVMVVSIGSENVRIGIEAPPGVVIDREEVRNEIERRGSTRVEAGR